MSESSEARTRRRWITFGEFVAFAALVVSALGVWISWKNSSGADKPTRIVEQKQAIPLTLRGTPENDGRRLAITPVEPGHALESLKITIVGGPTVETGGDGELSAGDLEGALKSRDKERKGSHSVPVRIAARYVEMGADRKGGGSYVLRYRWEGGGLFGGHSLRLTGLSRG
jgi:hypothetical protein